MRKLFVYGILVFCLVGFLSSNALAKITITAISGASKTVDLTQNPILVLGGSAGDEPHISACNTTGTCDTCVVCDISPCTANPLPACNHNSITPTTNINITFSSDNTSGSIQLYDSSTLVYDFSSNGAGAYTAGNSVTVSIPWGTLCDNLTSFCPTAGTSTKTLSFGISSNGTSLADYVSISFKFSNMSPDATDPYNTSGTNSLYDGTNGVEDFTLFPGDEKAYITDISPTTLSSTYNIRYLQVYYVPTSTGNECTTDMDTINITSDSIQVELDPSTHEVIDNRLDSGLANDQEYVFSFAIEDDTGNIGFFTNTTTLTCDATKHAVTPQEVFGLLEKNQNCFISTAAYGSPLNAKVLDFKKFRDQILKKYSWGRSFINYYYDHSPKYAHMISKSSSARAVVRAALWPLWFMSVISLKIGLWKFLAISLGSIFLLWLILKKRTSFFKFFIILLLFAHPIKAHSEDKYSDTDRRIVAQESSSQETAPQEPPYTGTDDDEFSSDSDIQEQPSPSYSENYIQGSRASSPNKWKPYARVPNEKRLKELSNKGLFKITKKGEYLYKVPESPQKSAASFRVGVADFPNLQNESGVTFQQIYGDSKKPLILVDYEWQFFQAFGKLGLKFESGLMPASGNGQFKTAVNLPDGSTTTDAKEKFTFLMFPNSLAAIYRLQLFHNQWIVPFAEGGIDYFTFMELRDDAKNFRFGGSPLAHFAVGGSFLLDVLGREAMIMVDREYGVNHMWLTAEYRHFENLGGTYDFSDDIFDAGFTVEF